MSTNAPALRSVPLDVPKLDVEELAMDMRHKLAMLIQWSEAESFTDRGGTTIELEQDAWRGMCAVLREVREAVIRIEQLALQAERSSQQPCYSSEARR